MDQPGIGHNSGARHQPGAGFRRLAWSKARAALIGPTMPIEIVRRRMKRAKELGLSYPHYASILMGTGRDVTAFLFTVEGLHLRLRRELEMPAEVRGTLQGLERCGITAFAPSGEDVEAFRVELSACAGRSVLSAAPEPELPAAWGAARRAVRDALDPVRLPSNTVVLIGSRDSEERWAKAANMARYLPREALFARDAKST